MLNEIDSVILQTGETMRVCLLQPPADEWMERMTSFTEHYNDQPRRDITQRLRGDYAYACEDFYFMGIIDGQVAGQVWYGYAKDSDGIANFGNVYTAPMHRKKGITGILMEYFSRSFRGSGARAAFCTCGNPWIVSIYTKYGFRPALPGTGGGPLMLANEGITADFTRFADNYYKIISQAKLSVVPADIRQRHSVDTLLNFYGRLPTGHIVPRIALASIVWNYQYALHLVQDGCGKLFAAVTDDDRVVGWAFCLNPASHFERRTGLIDYEIHPNYAAFAPTLIRETAMASKDSFDFIHAQIPSFAIDKHKALIDAGFTRSNVLSKYGCHDGQSFDLEDFQR
ncbi:MAG: GNAT family N-acetyltransferase [Phycisphaerae bacterium]